MVIRFVFLFAIFLDIHYYPNAAAKASPPSGLSPFPVASTTQRVEVSDVAAATGHSQPPTKASLQRLWAPSLLEGSNGGDVQTSMEMYVVQASQQEPGDALRFMLHWMGKMCGHTICSRGQVGPKSKEKNTGTTMGGIAVDNCPISEQAFQKGNSVAQAQRQGTEGQEGQSTELRCASTGSTMARFGVCASTAAAHLVWNGPGQRQYLTELVAALETSEQPITADVQKVIDKTKQPTATAKSVSQAFQKLEKKRKQLVSAQQARQNLHQSWNTYLEESVKRWRTFAEDFATKDQELEKKVMDAKDAMQDAKDKHDEAKAALDKKDAVVLNAQMETEEISDDNMEESPQEKLATAAEVQEGINTMIQTLDNGRVKPTEIDEERNSKKPRLEGHEQSSFGSGALKPFGKPDK